jgi:hypothetical protein
VLVVTARSLTREERDFLSGRAARIFQKGSAPGRALADEVMRLLR